MEKQAMPLVKVGPKCQVVIPKNVRRKLDIKPGDYVEISVQRTNARIKPMQVVERYTDEPLGPKTRAGIRQGLKDIKEGKVSGPFDTAEDVQAHLDSLKRKK